MDAHFFQQAGLGIGPVKDCILPVRPLNFQNIMDNPFRLLIGLAVLAEGHQGPLFVGCPQGLPLPPHIIADHGIGGIQDMAGRTVILFQADDLRPREHFFKVQDIPDIRPPEFID